MPRSPGPGLLASKSKAQSTSSPPMTPTYSQFIIGLCGLFVFGFWSQALFIIGRAFSEFRALHSLATMFIQSGDSVLMRLGITTLRMAIAFDLHSSAKTNKSRERVRNFWILWTRICGQSGSPNRDTRSILAPHGFPKYLNACGPVVLVDCQISRPACQNENDTLKFWAATSAKDKYKYWQYAKAKIK